jgi:hypothetical protein
VFLCVNRLFRYAFAKFIVEVLLHLTLNKSSTTGGKTVLFALSWLRVKVDAQILENTGEYAILYWPDKIQFFIQHRFLDNLIEPDDTSNAGSKKWLRRDRELYDFLNLMFPIYLKRISAKAVIGANFWYKQDFRFGKVAQSNKVPYLVLFKESLKISPTERKALFDFCRELGRFSGEKILTHNQIVSNILVRSKYCRRDQVTVTGACRMSSFIEQCKSTSIMNNQHFKEGQVTLFSFTPGISLNALGINPFPRNPYKGWVRLFEGVHSCFAEVAINNPTRSFVIKTKFAGVWHQKIREACLSRGINVDAVENLTITDQLDPHDLILNSSVIVGFASTTLLESGLAARNIIIPDFDEALDPFYRKHIKLLDFYQLAEVAKNREHFKRLIERRIRVSKSVVTNKKQKIRNEFFNTNVASIHSDPIEATKSEINSAIMKFSNNL